MAAIVGIEAASVGIASQAMALPTVAD